MQNDRKAGNTFFTLFQNIEPEWWDRLTGFEFICTVAGADGNCQGVNTGLFDKLFDFLRLRVGGMFLRDLVLETRQNAQLRLNRNIELMGILDNFSGKRHILFKREV